MAAAGHFLFFLFAPALFAYGPWAVAAAAEEECIAAGSCAAPDADADNAALIMVQSKPEFGGKKRQARRFLRRCFQERPDLEVFFPGDAGYNDSRRIHNYRVAHLVIPNVTVKATSREDVRLALSCAEEAGLGALAASGMNAYEAFCTEGCVLILTAGMKRFRIDQDNWTAMFEPGHDNGEVYYHLYKGGGFALPSGTINIVGLGGIALGGGKGYTTRLHGLLSDHIYKVEVMLYNGTVVNASEEENPDLLWLCRGGGGMEVPGVVVAFHFGIVRAPERVATIVLKWDLGEKLEAKAAVPFLEAWQTHLVANEDRRLHARLEPNLFDLRVLQLTCYFVDGTSEEALEVMAPFFAAPGVGMPKPEKIQKFELPWLDTIKNSSGMCSGSPACQVAPPNNCVEDEEPMNATGLEVLVDAFSNPPASGQPWRGLYMQIDPTNGKSSEVPPSATAYRWRSPASMTMQLVINWEDNVTNNPTWEKYSFDFIYNLSAWAEGGISYVNYLDKQIPSGIDPKRAYWGQNAEKVVDVMRKYTTGTATTTYWLTH